MSQEVQEIKEALAPYKPCFDIDTSMSLQGFLDSLDSEHISWGIIYGPSLVKYLREGDWEKLTGEDWRWLLRKQPQFANKCPWEKLDKVDWECLLEEQPQFKKYKPQEK